MRMIESEKVIPLVRPLLLFHPNAERIIEDMQAVVDSHTIEAEPVRHSFWESYSTSAYGGYKDGEVRWLPRQYYRCERCRKGSAIRSHYCPSCGAKMEG